jgi:hypothetical protein
MPSDRLKLDPATKGDGMPDYVRVATFEADENALNAIVNEIKSAEGPPPDIPSTAITVLADRAGGKVRIVVRFGSEEDLRKGSEALEAMEPPPDANVRRISVEAFEIVLERQAP